MKTFPRIFAFLALVALLAACMPPAATPIATEPPVVETPAPVGEGQWWNETVFYELFVRSFNDSDGDGVGDFNGVIEKLDYLNDGDPNTTTDLGVTGIWLMPINESPSYHGYDVVDYYTVDTEYGTKEDFLRLVDEAHKRGIKIIIDLVLNHTSTKHPWFEKSNAGDAEYRNWYIWSDTNPKFKGPWNQDVWYAGKDGYYYAVFWSQMPDLNLENPEVTAEIYEITRFWLEEMNVDGFRMDAVKHYVEAGAVQENTPATHTWLQAFHTYYKSVDADAFAVGEAWTNNNIPQMADYTGDEVDIVFEFDLAGAFVRSANGPIAATAITQMENVVNGYPEGQFGVFLTNHDQDRVMSLLKDFDKAKLAAVMLLTAPGVPFIYYGEEIGMTGTKPDENIRRPMQWEGTNSKVGFTTGIPWNAPSIDYKEVNVSNQTGDPASLLSTYRDLIQLRNEHAALRTGDTLVVDADTQRLYAILRYNDEEAFLVLVNVHPKPLTPELYSLTLEKGPFKGALSAVSVFGQADPAAPEINAEGGFTGYIPLQEIPAESAVIIQLKP